MGRTEQVGLMAYGLSPQYSQSFVVHNVTDEPVDVRVALRVHNLEILGAHGKCVRVEANNRCKSLHSLLTLHRKPLRSLKAI